MPFFQGAIPDTEVAPVIVYIAQARKTIGERLDYNEILSCLLVVALNKAYHVSNN